MADVMASSGESTREYRAIQRHYSILVDNLGKTVDPAHFARQLRDEALISRDIVDKASVVGVLTGSERINPAIDAVLAQIKLKADNFHTFMSILKAENSDLTDTISEYYTSSLELHALGVLESVSDWKELGHQLSIDPEKLLQLSQSGRDSHYCLEQVVMEWLKRDKEASWEKLCRALEQMGSEAEVLTIREQYACDSVPTAGSSEDVDADHLHSTESVAEEVNKFEGRFSDLVYRLQTEMEEKETPVKKFRNSITYLPQAIRKEHLQFIKDSLDDIMNAVCIEKLFAYLNMYWNFFDSSLLEHFVARHGSEELKEEMEKYTSDLKVFRMMTTIEQLLKVYPCGFRSEEPPPNFSQIVSKLDRNTSEYTLEELEQHRQQFCNKFSLPTFAFMLASFGEGSIIIVWHIPSSEVYRFHNATIQWNSISTELLELKVDGKLASKFSDQALISSCEIGSDERDESPLRHITDEGEEAPRKTVNFQFGFLRQTETFVGDDVEFLYRSDILNFVCDMLTMKFPDHSYGDLIEKVLLFKHTNDNTLIPLGKEEVIEDGVTIEIILAAQALTENIALTHMDFNQLPDSQEQVEKEVSQDNAKETIKEEQNSEFSQYEKGGDEQGESQLGVLEEIVSMEGKNRKRLEKECEDLRTTIAYRDVEIGQLREHKTGLEYMLRQFQEEKKLLREEIEQIKQFQLTSVEQVYTSNTSPSNEPAPLHVHSPSFGSTEDDNKVHVPKPSPPELQTAIPSVLVVYSPRCPTDEKYLLLQVLLSHLQSCGIHTTFSDWHFGKESIPMWIEQEVKRSTAVLCVCNRQFQQEWEQQVATDCAVVYALKQLVYASLSQCEDLSSKFAVVLLRQSHHQFIPTQYLQSVNKFYVNEVDKIAHFVLDLPHFVLKVKQGPKLQTAIPSVLVIYSPQCPTEDKHALLQLLLSNLQSYEIHTTSHDFHLKGNIPMWIEQEVKRSTAVLCVCNRQFQQEWEQQITTDCAVVYALKQLMYASLSQREDLSSKFAVVLLRQSDRQFIPTQYLQSVKKFLVNEVKEIAHFVHEMKQGATGDVTGIKETSISQSEAELTELLKEEGTSLVFDFIEDGSSDQVRHKCIIKMTSDGVVKRVDGGGYYGSKKDAREEALVQALAKERARMPSSRSVHATRVHKEQLKTYLAEKKQKPKYTTRETSKGHESTVFAPGLGYARGEIGGSRLEAEDNAACAALKRLKVEI